jgi:hypothetical protein
MENIDNDNSILLSIKYNIDIKNQIKESINNILKHTEHFYSEYDNKKIIINILKKSFKILYCYKQYNI